jgi:dihydroorotate dehydrogenase (NAD+) catalytic subunit
MYNANASYEENYAKGPQAEFNGSGTLPLLRYLDKPRYHFLGRALHIPFGIPAGPLLNAGYVKAAWGAGFALPVYKTVRSRAWKSHPFPNVLALEGEGRAALSPLFAKPDSGPTTVRGRLFEKTDYSNSENLSISNSFGVPSQPPEVWHEDFVSLKNPEGMAVVLSFQGSRSEGEKGFEDFLSDTIKIARLALRTARLQSPEASPLLEINLSCPNEAGAPIFVDVDASLEILRQVRFALDSETFDKEMKPFQNSGVYPPKAKLIAKIGVLSDAACLRYVNEGRRVVDAYSCLNTVSARILSHSNGVILGAGVETGGVCGKVVFQQALRMMEKLSGARRASRIDKEEMSFVGVGGVARAEEFLALRHAGADVVQAATGTMWNLELAGAIARACGVPFQWEKEGRQT